MALIKKIYTEDNTGVYAEYWKVSEINSNWITNKIEIILVGYISEDARRSEKSALLKRVAYATGSDAIAYFSAIVMQPEGIDIIREAYLYVKANSIEFHDAIDALD
jgi:hypothetical protein